MHKGDADDLPEKLKSESLAGILKQIALSKSISIQDGIALAKLIDGGPMPADASGAILSAIQNKVDLCSADAQQTHGRQIHPSLEHYQSVTDWAWYGQKDMDHDRKLSIMAKRMVSLFLVNPSEPTIASAVAIALHHDGPLNPAYLLTKVRRMKAFLQAMTKDMTRCDAPANYPSDVEKFKEEHSTIYTLAFQNDPVMQCPIDAVTMQFLKQTTPCRKTKAGCSDMIAQHCKPNNRSSVGIIQNTFGRQPSHVELPGFRLCIQQPVFAGHSPLALPPPPVEQYGIREVPNQLALRADDGPPGPKPTQTLESQSPAHASVPEKALASQSPADSPASQGLVADKPKPAESTVAMTTKVSDMVAQWQAKAKEAKLTAEGSRGAGDDAGEDVNKETAGAAAKAIRKRPSAATPKPPTKKHCMGVKLKPEAKKSETKAFDDLKFMKKSGDSKGNSRPRYYGSVTIYCDKIGKQWRVKPGPGERVEKKFIWGPDEASRRKSWKNLVSHVKGLKQH